MGLNAKGIISAIEIAFYVPVLLVAIYLVKKHGASRREGWFYILTFSIIRIVGAAIYIDVDLASNPSTSLFITALVLQAAGLTPLLIATLGFARIVQEKSTIQSSRFGNLFFRGLRLALVAAVVLAIIGGTEINSTNPNTLKQSSDLRRASAIVFAAIYGILVLLHAYLWFEKDLILQHRRTLLKGITAALPFLLVRVIYSILSSFSPSPFGQRPNALSKFNTFSGTWETLLFMGILMEFCVVVIYSTMGTILPLSKEVEEEGHEENFNMHRL